MSKTIYKAAKYIRLSYTDDKTKESDSVQNQRQQLDSFIQNQPDIESVSEWVDDGVSGLLFDRPAFKEMMTEIEAGKINCVIVKDMSRLGREYIETGRYLRRIFPAYGVRFIAINDNIDTLKDRTDDLVVSVKSIINDAYSRDISVKTRSALNAKRENGDYVGALPVYGYVKDSGNHNQLVIDEYPANIVRTLFRMKIDGMSAERIAKTLNELGVLSPLEYKKSRGFSCSEGGFGVSGGAMIAIGCLNESDNAKRLSKWSATSIIRILQDETYTGTLIQGKVGTPNYKIKNIITKPKSEWKRFEDAHEAIISPLDFDLAQRIMLLDTRTAPGSESVYLFSGLLICDSCGGRMTRKAVPYKGVKYHYYYCPTTKKRGCLDAPTLRENDLHDYVLDCVKSQIGIITDFSKVISESGNQKAANALMKQYSTQIEESKRQLSKITSLKSGLYENMVTGVISKADYKSMKAQYAVDEERLRNAIEGLEAQLDEVVQSNRLSWTEHFRRFENLTELNRRIVINLIQSVRVISKTQLQITFNYQNEFNSALSALKAEVA